MFPCRSAWMAPMFACIASIEFLVSAWAAPMFSWIAPIRSKSRSTAEPGRERRDEEVDLFDTLEERPDLVSILQFNERISNQLPTTIEQVITIVTVQLTLS